MSINFFGLHALGGKNYGEVWKPKTQRLMVGRELAPLTATALESKSDRAVTIGKGDDVAFMSGEIFNLAKSQTQSGRSVGNFRSYENAQAVDWLGKNASVSVHDDDKYHIALRRNGGEFALTTYEKITDESGRESLRQLDQARFTNDAKISWEGGAPKILTGAAAREGDTLAAAGQGEILIRTSDAKVSAGENTTVYNFSDSGGEFSGGNNVTYLGSYARSIFKEGAGETVYAGYFQDSKFSGGGGTLGRFSGVFENSEIEAGGNSDVFSGYFSASKINGGNGENIFSGLFLNRSSVSGGDDKDAFNGRYIASDLFGGKGDDSFGRHIDLNNLSRITSENGMAYHGLAPDFIKANAEAGEGDDQFTGAAWESQIRLGDGDDQARGAFTSSSLDGGEGDNNLSAMYSLASLFTAGGGNDKITLASSVASLINPGEGKNQVTLGHNRGETAPGDVGGDHLMPDTRWLTPEEERNGERGLAFGELRANLVEASRGENQVAIHNGEGVNQVATGDILEAGEAENEVENAAEALAQEKTQAGKTALAEQSGELSVQTGQARQGLALLEGEPAPEAAAEAGENKKRKVIGRYVAQSGDAPLQAGGLAATVKTGAGENLNFRGLDRGPAYERLADETPVSSLLRNAFDAYAWTAKLG